MRIRETVANSWIQDGFQHVIIHRLIETDTERIYQRMHFKTKLDEDGLPFGEVVKIDE